VASKRGGGRALERALLSGGIVEFDGPDPGLSIHAEAASGIVLPLRTRGRLAGLWAVESTRRRDFTSVDGARLAACAEELAPALCVAQFRGWHRERFGYDVYFHGGGPHCALRADDVLAAGRARAPIAVCGPGGSGKRVVARWLHYESDRRAEPIGVFACGTSSADETRLALWGSVRELAAGADSLEGLFASTASGTVVLIDVERLEPQLQATLLQWLDARDARGDHARHARLIVTSRSPLADIVQQGGLRADLGERLQRMEIDVPPLDRRREELPALIEVLARRFAHQEGQRIPSFSDEAIALCWRQPWPGNVRELENLVYKLVLLAPRGPVLPEHVEAIAARFRRTLARRVASRHPDPATLRAALRTTAHQRGTINKTRAALYLGWDPDTLVARLGELGWSEASVWETPATPTPPEPT
jgi:DNA-binding NtrC family response regulator